GRGSRRYDLLTLRYVEQQEIDEVCTRLGISRGFYFREHNAALDAVAALLGAALNVTAPAPRERPARNNMALVKIPEPEVEASAAPAPAAPPLPQRAPLVGREKEFAALLDQVQMARQGSGRVALLGGAPGVGKTRLVQELGRLVTAEGGMFLEGQFTREAGIQHFPWVDVLRTGLQSVGAGEMAQVIGPFGPHLAAILPEFAGTAGSPSPAGSPLDERRALYDGITHVVTQLAQRTPVVVIVIDDMQWAAGLSLFEHVARRLERARVLLIGVYRDQELQQESALFAQHVGLLRLPHATGLPLSPLTLTETTELATHFVGSGPATTLAARLFSRTRGNPYFITEVLRSLGDRRGLHWDGAAWRLQEPVQLALPDSIKMLIDQWAARAGTVADRLLRQAAVLGLEFSVPALREMSGLPDDALAEALDASETARLIRDQTAPGEEQYAFSDDQVQEVLYDGLPGAQRRRLHQRAGDAYEAVYAKDTAPWVEELARHFAEGGSPAKGAAYAIQAGRRAEQVFDGERAAMHYTTALGLLRAQGAPAAELAALCERLAIVYTETPAAHMPSLPLLDEALALYRQAGDVRREARIHVRLGRERLGGNRGVTRHMAASREHLETARTLLEPLGAGRELVETYAYLSVLMPQILQFEASLRWADQAIAVYQTVSAGKLGGIGIAASLALVCRGDNLAGWAIIEEAWSDARDTR
ncbi:MAG: AAA family ATPase, partial [Chloroflexi bacterium]|nr:AAA family ATPase [Chloroflexota bacterium]